MLNYPTIDPVAIALGPFKVHWYGLMYVIGFIAAWWLGRRRASRVGLTGDDVGDLIFYAAIGVVVGWVERLADVLFTLHLIDCHPTSSLHLDARC